MLLNGLIIILIPFLGTSLGSAVVLFSKGELNQKLQKFLLGFASGVMIAASIWSLLIPSIEMGRKSEHSCVDSCDSRIFARNWIFAFARQRYTAYAP